VKDAYGRYCGSVIGFSIDSSGELKSIGLDQCEGQFQEFASNRIISDKDGFIMIPAWKVAADALGRETETVRRRAQALADLEKEGEIPVDLREEMHDQYDGELKRLRESYIDLGAEVRRRIEALDRQAKSLDRFLLNLKVQFRSGEIDEGTFKAEAEYCAMIKQRDTKERDDLRRLLTTVIDPVLTSNSASPAATPAAAAVQPRPVEAPTPQVTLR
jgi:CdvA-like coiled-coil domain